MSPFGKYWSPSVLEPQRALEPLLEPQSVLESVLVYLILLRIGTWFCQCSLSFVVRRQKQADVKTVVQLISSV